MKKLFILLVLACTTLFLHAQNFSLTINSHDTKADSIHLQDIKRVKISDANKRFDGEILYRDILSAPCGDKVVLKQKAILKPGYYRVMADTSLLFELLVSDEKKQKITAHVDNGKTTFEGSPENNEFRIFTEKENRYQFQQDSLNQIFEKARQSMPPYMLQDMAQRLISELKTLTEANDAYKQKAAATYPGSLLASIIRFSEPLSPPPAGGRQDATFMMVYNVQHAFEHYPFDDGRMATTPMAMDRMIFVTYNLFYLDPALSPALADSLLMKARVNPDNYHAFFNVMESAFGTPAISFWTEEIYLAMLNNALNYSQLEERRVKYYQYLYDLQSKNLAGSQFPDIPIQWGDDTKTSLYDIASEYILLDVQDPECHTCAAVRNILAENEELNQAIANGKIKVVTLYYGKNETAWRNYLKNRAVEKFQHGWDYEGKIEEGNLVDLRTIPVLFLLDKDKKVLKKNIAHYEISDYLKHYGIAK